MNIYSLVGLINGIVATLLGIFVFTRNRKSTINVRFLYFCLCLAVWNYGYFIWLNSTSSKMALFWLRMLMIGTMFIPSTFLHYTLEFLGLNKGWRKKILIYGYVIDFFFLLFILNPILIAGVRETGFYIYAPWPGPLFHIFLIKFMLYSVYAHFLLYKAYHDVHGVKYYQIKLSFWGIVVGYIGGVPIWLLWYGFSSPPVTHILVSAYMMILAYAIVRHQLMDITVIIKKTLVFAGLFAIAFGILVLPTLLIQEYIASYMGAGGRLIGISISALLIVLIFKRLENFLVNITDKFLFQKKYDYKELLKTFTTEVLSVLDLKKLVEITTTKLTDIMKIESCSVLLLDEAKNNYKLAASKGINDKDIVLTKESTLTTFLGRTRSYLSTKHQGKDSPLPKRILQDMNKLKLELAIPLIIHDDMIGILTLGKKKSDEDYSQDDMDILLPLASTLAIAISNAEVLDELGKTQAEAAQREKMAVIGTLSAGINHEICNPLGIARGQCEAFLLNLKDGIYKNKTPDELMEKAKSIMEKVIHETDRATVITKRLSSFSKPSKGLLSDDIDIKVEIDEVLALVGYEMKLDKIEVQNNVSKDLAHIAGDKKQIQEVFFNLIRNAAQAMQEKGKIAITADDDSDGVHVKIADTGHGIPEEKLGQIFNPFYTTKEPGKGTGLGLFIVKQVVERNKGRISVESVVGKGTTFTLSFPASVMQRV